MFGNKSHRQVKFRNISINKETQRTLKQMEADSDDNSISDSDENVYAFKPSKNFNSQGKPFMNNTKLASTNFGKEYKFTRTLNAKDISDSSNTLRRHKKSISPWRKILEINKKHKNNPTCLRLGTKILSARSRSRQSKRHFHTDKISNKLFFQWQSELCRHTDLSPVIDKSPPLAVTKPKAFAFESTTRDKNNINKEPSGFDSIERVKVSKSSRVVKRQDMKALKLSPDSEPKKPKSRQIKTRPKIMTARARSRNCFSKERNNCIVTFNLCPRQTPLYKREKDKLSYFPSRCLPRRPFSVEADKRKKSPRKGKCKILNNIFIFN
ncbi:unnamed protein product [Moneuplotes crassus]|uniref:Uncharacterized protein n=1 Tax=Euplotes crassus TaxID=5936 RepID=A0AAD1US65_EUPCR|nr:unnamed protein product [Moneuplotes crassus]